MSERNKSNTVFVGGISWKADEQSLKEFFSTYGSVVDCKIIVDRDTNKSKGYGFVTFKDVETAETVKQSTDLSFLGKVMNVGNAYRKNSNPKPTTIPIDTRHPQGYPQQGPMQWPYAFPPYPMYMPPFGYEQMPYHYGSPPYFDPYYGYHMMGGLSAEEYQRQFQNNEHAHGQNNGEEPKDEQNDEINETAEKLSEVNIKGE